MISNSSTLVYWDEVDFEVGDRLVSEVSFEWSQFNSEAHVYSPQLDFPALWCAMSMETINFAQSPIWDIYWEPLLEDDTAIVMLEWVDEEVPLAGCNCSVRAGEFSWAAEYVDMLGDDYGVELEWAESLSSVVDSGGNIDYDDADGDGNLSSGDSILVRGLSVPDCESGLLCYMLHLGLGAMTEGFGTGLYYLPMYLPLMSQGVLRNLDGARYYVCLEAVDMPTGFRLEVEYSAYPHLWSDASAVLSADANCSDLEYTDYVWVDPFAEGLDTGSESTWSSGPVSLETMTWNVSVTDVEGDGTIGVGDYVLLESDESDVASVLEYLDFRLMYEPTDVSLTNQMELIDTSD